MKSLLTIGFLLLVLTFAQAFRVATVAHRLQTQTGLNKGDLCSGYSAQDCPKDHCVVKNVTYKIGENQYKDSYCRSRFS